MQVVSDPEALERLLESRGILSHFRSRALPFRLLRYQKGELLTTPMKPLSDLLFIVRGQVKVYGLREDGSSLAISLGEQNAMLGDMEFARRDFPSFYTEALEEVLCISLPIEENRTTLEEDCVFLRYLLGCVTHKVLLFALIGHSAQPIEEKVLIFLQRLQPDHTLHGISAGLLQFHCSRRQLQRVVKRLCEQGRLEKIGRGEYRLKEP